MIALTPRLWLALALLAVIVWLIRRHRTAPAAPADDPGTGTEGLGAADDRDLRAARHWSADEVRLGVERHLFGGEQDHDPHLSDRLLQQPGRTLACVRRVLDDPEMQMRLWRRRDGVLPWARACELLDHRPQPSHAGYFRMLTDLDDRPLRRSAWRWLARTGSAAATEPLLRGLDDEDPEVRLAVLRGLLDADLDGRVDDALRTACVEPLVEHLDAHVDELAVAARLLLRVAPERALHELDERQLLDPASPAGAACLGALLDEHHLLPRERLLQLWPRAALPSAAASARAVLLRMLGHHRHEDDEARLRGALAAEDPREVEAAAAGLRAFHGFDHWRRVLLDQRPADGLVPAERQLLAASEMDREVRRAGFASWLGRTTAEQRADALAALVTGRDPDRRQLLEQALANDAAPHAHARLDDAWRAVRPSIDVTLTRVMLAHGDALRAAWPSA